MPSRAADISSGKSCAIRLGWMSTRSDLVVRAVQGPALPGLVVAHATRWCGAPGRTDAWAGRRGRGISGWPPAARARRRNDAAPARRRRAACVRTRRATSKPSWITSTRRLLTCSCSRTCGNCRRKSGTSCASGVLRQGHGAADLDHAARLGADAIDRLARRLGFGQHRLRVAVHALPDVGDREPARRALQQAHAQVGFELGDAPAQARLRDAERTLGRGVAAVLDDHGEELQVVEVRGLHAMRSRPPMYGRSTSGTVIAPSACW